MSEKEVDSGASYCAHYIKELFFLFFLFFFFLLYFLIVIFPGHHTTYSTGTDHISELMIQFCLWELLLTGEEVEEGNKVWHVDSRLNFPGVLNGQLLKFNCSPCLSEEL